MSPLVIAGTLVVALLIEGLLARPAHACGGEEPPDYGPDKPVVKSVRGRTEVTLNFRRKAYDFRGGGFRLAEVKLATRDQRFARWLGQKGMDEATWKQLRLAAQRQTCASLFNGQTIARLERSLALAAVKAYRRATRRPARLPDAMLVAEDTGDGPQSCNPTK